ncbi:MAG: sugar phosphate isomerase/epimerase [Phycisphaerae bacterium]|nr:sugar phosphate isomerase/epimerase [Phycisphaerae bacterium]
MEMNLSRRVVLKGAGLMAAMGTVPSLWADEHPQAEPSRPWKMRLSASSICFMELPIEQAVEKISGLGFEGIDIWSAHEGCPHLDDIAKRLGPNGLKELLAKHKLKLFSFSVYAGGFARYAELLGACGGGVAVQGSAGPCKPEELAARMKQYMEELKPLAELAEKHNSILAVENHSDALLNTLDSLKAFVDLNRSPRIGIALAPYHIQGLKASVPEAIRVCGKQLRFFYAWQRQEGDKQLPGVGSTDMTDWIAALKEIRYAGFVNPFTHSHPGTDIMTANLKTARQYLVSCYQKTNPESASSKG